MVTDWIGMGLAVGGVGLFVWMWQTTKHAEDRMDERRRVAKQMEEAWSTRHRLPRPYKQP